MPHGSERCGDLPAVMRGVVEHMRQRGRERCAHRLALAGGVAEGPIEIGLAQALDIRLPGPRALLQPLRQSGAVGLGLVVELQARGRHALKEASLPQQAFAHQQMIEGAVNAVEKQPAIAAVIGFGEQRDVLVEQAMRGPDVIARQGAEMVLECHREIRREELAVNAARPSGRADLP